MQKLSLPQKPTYKKIAEDVDFFALFQKIEQAFATCFLLESLGEDGKYSRYSIIGFAPEHSISARGNTLTIDGEKSVVANPYYELRKLMPDQVLSREYAGGLVGYLSYEAINYMESGVKVKVHDQFDQFMFGIYTDGVVYDKVTSEIFYFFYETDRSYLVHDLLNKESVLQSFSARFLRSTQTKEAFFADVAVVKEHIRAGNTFQCEVGFKAEYEVTGNPLLVYQQLRQVNPSPFMYFMKFGNKKTLGAAPELLFSLRDGELLSRPLAGTTSRGKTEEEDQKLAREMLNDPKERAEHMMIVDMHRSDMGKVSRFGTVRVKDLMTTRRFSHLQHISSDVVGMLDSKEDMFSALATNFPMPTVCGTPRVETIKIIDANEPDARGPYGGSIGHFGFNGDATFALPLRSFYISDNYGYTQSSAGIVDDSVAEKEYEEVLRKLAAMEKVLGQFST